MPIVNIIRGRNYVSGNCSWKPITFLNFELNTVEDANYGLLIEDGGTVYQMNDNSFLPNNIGIGISSRAIIANDIYSNIFDGTRWTNS